MGNLFTLITDNSFGNDKASKAKLWLLDGQGNYARSTLIQSTPHPNTLDASTLKQASPVQTPQPHMASK